MRQKCDFLTIFPLLITKGRPRDPWSIDRRNREARGTLTTWWLMQKKFWCGCAKAVSRLCHRSLGQTDHNDSSLNWAQIEMGLAPADSAQKCEPNDVHYHGETWVFDLSSALLPETKGFWYMSVSHHTIYYLVWNFEQISTLQTVFDLVQNWVRYDRFTPDDFHFWWF